VKQALSNCDLCTLHLKHFGQQTSLMPLKMIQLTRWQLTKQHQIRTPCICIKLSSSQTKKSSS